MREPEEVTARLLERQARLLAREHAQHQMQSVPFTVFDAETGAVLRAGTSQRRDLMHQSTAPNEIVLEGEFQDGMYRIEITEAGPVAVLID